MAPAVRMACIVTELSFVVTEFVRPAELIRVFHDKPVMKQTILVIDHIVEIPRHEESAVHLAQRVTNRDRKPEQCGVKEAMTIKLKWQTAFVVEREPSPEQVSDV